MALEGRRLRLLAGMGIQAWVARAPASSTEQGGPGADSEPALATTATPGSTSADGSIEALDWEALASRVAGCRACVLCEGRTQAVFGTGDRSARWLIIGEAPGADEDRLGEPFVGRAGQLLNAMIQATGARREQVYIANIVKCRPPSNRNPRVEEALSCAPYLARQIALIQPELILAVGRVAASNLLHSEETIGRMRGRVHRFDPGNIPVVVTYHPAYLLRKPSEKAKSWADLQLAMSIAQPHAN